MSATYLTRIICFWGRRKSAKSWQHYISTFKILYGHCAFSDQIFWYFQNHKFSYKYFKESSMVKAKYLVGKSSRQSLSVKENGSFILIVEIYRQIWGIIMQLLLYWVILRKNVKNFPSILKRPWEGLWKRTTAYIINGMGERSIDLINSSNKYW